MSSVSGQGPLSPNDPEYYAPARVRERFFRKDLIGPRQYPDLASRLARYPAQ